MDLNVNMEKASDKNNRAQKKHTKRLIRKRALLKRQMNDEYIQASEIDARVVTGYKSFYNRKVKRVIDTILASFILVIMSPVFLVVSLGIVLEDGFPILYRAERGGYKNKPFKICKFRSMIKNADKVGGDTTALNDNRITKVGSIIRKMKIDETPNLLNVIRGDMSFIGPRPELLRYTEQYTGTEKAIFEVRPGMTDYSSLEFINLDEIVGSQDADEMYERYVLPRKNKLRVKYAATVSFVTDAKLFFLTIWKVMEKCYGFVVKKKHR